MRDPSSSSRDSDSAFVAVRHERTQSTLNLPYARSRDSNHSGSGWEDAQSAQSSDVDDTLEMLAAEISSRRIPTRAPVIMEDSPGQIRPTSNALMIMEDSPGKIRPAPSTLMAVPLPGNLTDNESQIIVDTVMTIEQEINDPLPNPTNVIDAIMPPDQQGQPQTNESQLISNRMGLIQAKAEQQFTTMAVQLKDGQNKQNHIATAADTLVNSL